MSQRKRQLNRQDTPPPVIAVPRLTIIRPGPAQRFMCCSVKMFGLQTHWDIKNRCSCECTKPVQLCTGHAKRLPLRWKGVLTMQAEYAKKAELIDIPPETGVTIEAIASGQSLRGMILEFVRETSNIRSRLLVTLFSQYDGMRKIPDEIDPVPTLKKVLKFTE